MPTYTVQCQGCQARGHQKFTFIEYDEIKSGKSTLTCPNCQGVASLCFNPGNVNFVLKDGESGGWVSKATKENAFREKHNKVMDRRQRDHARRTTLQPNFGGKLTGTWKTAKEAAYDATYDTVKQEFGSGIATQAAQASAGTFDPLVKKEVSG